MIYDHFGWYGIKSFLWFRWYCKSTFHWSSFPGYFASSKASICSVDPPEPTRGPGGSATQRKGTLGSSPASCFSCSWASYQASWEASPALTTTRSQNETPAWNWKVGKNSQFLVPPRQEFGLVEIRRCQEVFAYTSQSLQSPPSFTQELI